MTDEKKRRILRIVDLTLLRADASWGQIDALCREAVLWKTASVCIPPSYVKRAAETFGDSLQICTVIGFPLGYHTTGAKVFEARESIENGAQEIDLVINLGDLKNGDLDSIRAELGALRQAAAGKVLKVIIETCYLTREEKIILCGLVTESGADFIKTSTGFGPAGAALEDLALMREHVGPGVKIKAAGGIRTAEDLEAFFDRGADRIGSSSAVKALGLGGNRG